MFICSPRIVVMVFLLSAAIFRAYSQELQFEGVRALPGSSGSHGFFLILKDSCLVVRTKLLSTRDEAVDWITAFPSPGIGNFIPGHTPYLVDGRLLFTTSGTGMVYEALPEGITRIDRSFDHNMQKGSIEFFRKDTIWRHGGNGAWSVRNVITYFDSKRMEWEVLRPTKGETPPKLWNHRFLLNGDSLWVFGGYRSDASRPEVGVPNETVWLFNFQTNRWKKKGNLTADGMELDKTDNCLIQFGENKCGIVSSGIVSLFDFSRNEISYRKIRQPISQFALGSCMEVAGPFGYYLQFHRKNELSLSSTDGYHIELVKVPIIPFLEREPFSKRDLFVPGERFLTKWSGWIVGAVLLLLLFMIGFRPRKTQKPPIRKPDGKIRVMDNGIEFEGSFFPMEQNELKVIRLLLQADGEVGTTELVAGIENANLDYTQNLRIKNQLVESINIRLKAILNIHYDPVKGTRSGRDKRMRIYSIDKQLFE